MNQNAGEKGIPHPFPEDPPRRRANKFNGHGTFANDRPPIVGVIGRVTGAVALEMVEDSTHRTLEAFVVEKTQRDAIINTDEWSAYQHLSKTGRIHWTVRHGRPWDREWARDDDGDGIREVHCNTMEGHWVGLRNFLRPFGGVSKWFLDQYVAFFAALHNWAEQPLPFLGRLLGPFTWKAA